MKELWEKIKSFCKETWTKVTGWWNAKVSETEEADIREECEADGSDWEPKVYTNPIRRAYETLKAKVVRSSGDFGWKTIGICAGVITFVMLTGGPAIIATLGIAVASVAGFFIVLKRFPMLETLMLKAYKVLDMLLFGFMFLAATTIFGIQIAAITSVLASIGLIVWKAYKDEELLIGMPIDPDTYQKFEDTIMGLGDRLAEAMGVQEPALA